MSLRSILPLAGLLLLMPSTVWGQSTALCDAQGGLVSSVEIGDGTFMYIFHRPFTAICDDGTELRADSGQAVGPDIQLVGNVYFSDAVQTLTADEASYNRQTGRLYARGDVNLVNRAEGTTLLGPELEYFRANEEREEALVFATQRPTLTLEPKDSAGNPRGSEPLTLIGDRVNIVGNDDLTAIGGVVITQEGLTAIGEEAHYDSANETLELRQNAVITREESSISGEVVQAQMVDGSLQHVQSRTGARLEGEDLTVAAPDIQLFFDRDTLQQVVARVPSELVGERARAASRTFRTEADSIDARFVLGALDVVYAIGAARGETIDTTQAGAESLEMVTLPDSVASPVASAEPPNEPDSNDADIGEGEPEGQPPLASAAPDPVGIPDEPLGDGGTPAPPSAESIAAVTASDWIRGDTIIALFTTADSVAEADPAEVIPGADAAEVAPPAVAQADCDAEPCPELQEAEERDTPQLRKLIARRDAQSFYRLASENPADPGCRNLSFLVGAEIELDVAEGELEVANVRGLEQGLYLEANNCASTPPAGEPVDEDGAPNGDGTPPDPVATPPLLDAAMVVQPWE